jgi:hypothetical protein
MLLLENTLHLFNFSKLRLEKLKLQNNNSQLR